MSHKQKLKLAKKLNTWIDKKGIGHTPASGLFWTNAWYLHKMAVARRVEKRNARIHAAVIKKKEEQNARSSQIHRPANKTL